MPEAGTVMTVGEMRALLARLRESASDLERRLAGRLDGEILPPIPLPIPEPFPPFPPAGPECWPKPE
jgi:hypothetical protein